MRGLLVAVAIALLPLASRAAYDQTTWGMPLAKVRKLYPGGHVATIPNGDVEYRVNKHVGGFENALVVFKFPSTRLLNEVLIGFPAGGTFADLKTGFYDIPSAKDGESKARTLREHLTEKYGEPRSYTTPEGGQIDLWDSVGLFVRPSSDGHHLNVRLRYVSPAHGDDPHKGL
jgi:hypothetical protein